MKYPAFALLLVSVVLSASVQTTNAPRVHGYFVYGAGAGTCRKRCNDDAICLKECGEHRLKPDELRDAIKQKREQEKR